MDAINLDVHRNKKLESTSFLVPPAPKTLDPPAEKFTEGKLKPVKPELVVEENAEEVEANGLLVRVGNEEVAAAENFVGKLGLCVQSIN
jgi:hypothetical protein